MSKMIKEAQTATELTGRLSLAKEITEALGASSLETAKRILSENAGFGDDDGFGLTPDQIVDQVVNFIAPEAGVNPNNMTQQQFAKLASMFRAELEDHYDEVYSNGEWRKLTTAAWNMHVNPQGQQRQPAPEENEEFDDGSFGGVEPDQIYDQIAGYLAPQAGIDMKRIIPQQFMGLAHKFRIELQDHYDETYTNKEWNALVAGAWKIHKQAYGQENEEAGWPSEEQTGNRMPEGDDVDIDNREFENEELSHEQRGWYDCKSGKSPRLPNHPKYMSGYNRAGTFKKQMHTEEQEQSVAKKDDSLLKSLLAQRKELSAKASATSKKYEDEGAAAFHEFRMKHERSPYKDKSEEHNAWIKGFNKAALGHYAPVEEETDKKKKPVKK